LAANATIKLKANRISHHLTRQVDFKGTIDRHHFMITGDVRRRIEVVAGIKFHMGVIIYKVI